jgi:protein TonB
LDNSIEGTVVVKIIVEKDGSITYIAIVRNPGGGLGEEGERVVKLMPKWKPGYQKDMPVRVQFMIPIRFKLTSKKTKK